MSESLWKDSVKMPEFKIPEGTLDTEVLIVGGGICGILCAYFLDLLGVDYILAEAGNICGGLTGNTTAKITSQHGLIYDGMIKDFGSEKARLYLESNQAAVSRYAQLSKNIDCDFEFKSSYIYSLTDRKIIEKEIRAVNSLGFDAEFTEDSELPFKIQGAVKFDGQAQFNPLKFLAHISKNLNIYQNTFINEISGHTAYYSKGKISADKIIICSHFPFINKHGLYFIKMYQHRSYVTAVENAPDMKGMYADASGKGLSFRNYKNLLLIGGGSHRTGRQGGCWYELRKFREKNYPLAREKYSWAAQDCMTPDHIPYIGLYSKNTPDLYVATGFNKWGMTSSMAAAEILCDMTTGRDNRYQEVFSPQRSMKKPRIFVSMLNSAANLLTPSTKRCSHMGCALKWNKAEGTWDCPCHGSRFRQDGSVIDNPAGKNAKI